METCWYEGLKFFTEDNGYSRAWRITESPFASRSSRIIKEWYKMAKAQLRLLGKFKWFWNKYYKVIWR